MIQIQQREKRTETGKDDLTPSSANVDHTVKQVQKNTVNEEKQ